MSTMIDFYKDAYTVRKTAETSVLQFHRDVQEGRWQDLILPLRVKKQKGQDIKKLKEQLPLVTGSGTFSARNTSSLQKHSGFLVIDIDKLHPSAIGPTREALQQDSLFYSLFLSCSGTGLCGFVKINPKAHEESFYFMSEHLFTKYGINVDNKCVDVVRPRYVSYDPDLYLNEASQLCPIKPAPKKQRRRAARYHFATEDFNRIIADIREREIDLTEDYQDWIYAGFALVDKFGEDGRAFFHDISQFNPGYDYDKTDAKYTHLLETKTGSITIDWFYYIIEKNGLVAYGKETEDFLQTQLAEVRAYEAGLIDERPLSAATVSATDIPSMDVGIQVRDFLRAGYTLRKNEMTGSIEVNGETLDDELLNTLYLICRSRIDKLNSRDLVYQVLDSRFTPRYHEFKELMSHYDNTVPAEQAQGHIERLVASIETDTPNAGLFIKKWLVSIIGSMHGKHSPLMLVLTGVQNTGKTAWFRNLLPERLRERYYAESKMDEGKDDRILMSKKILIMDDEMSGKSKQEEAAMKSTLSRQQLDLRVPFGRTASTLKRIAVMCGTSNEEELLSDPTGNRRLLPVSVKSIHFEDYNSIDKDLLFYEAYLAYVGGYNYELSQDDIALLKESTKNFKKAVAEEDIIVRYLGDPAEHKGKDSQWLSLFEIMEYLKTRTRLNMNPTTLGKYMKALEFVQKHKKFKNTTIRKYHVVILDGEFEKFDEEIY